MASSATKPEPGASGVIINPVERCLFGHAACEHAALTVHYIHHYRRILKGQKPLRGNVTGNAAIDEFFYAAATDEPGLALVAKLFKLAGQALGHNT